MAYDEQAEAQFEPTRGFARDGCAEGTSKQRPSRPEREMREMIRIET